MKDIVGDECSLCSDFVVDIGPIMCKLRNNGLTCVATIESWIVLPGKHLNQRGCLGMLR